MQQQSWWTVKPKGAHGTPARPCAHFAMSARFGAYGTVDLGINATAVRPGASWEGKTG